MNQMIQTCKLIGHEEHEVKFICLHLQCTNNKLVCAQCLLENIHKHDNQNNSHIVNRQGLELQIQFKIDWLKKQRDQELEYSNQFVQRSIILIQKIKEQMNDILDALKEIQYYTFYTNKIQSFQVQLDNIRQTKIIPIDDQLIKQLQCMDLGESRIPNIKLIIQNSHKMISDIQKVSQLSQQLIKNKIEKEKEKYQSIKKLTQAKYQIKIIDELTDETTISNDLKYVVSGLGGRLEIWDCSNHRLIKYEYGYPYCTKFTDDSKLLYVGDVFGILYCYDVHHSFKQACKYKIHKKAIQYIYCITNTKILTSSDDKRIIKTDILNEEQILLINAHDNSVLGIDYDMLRCVIISCSQDSIKLWNDDDGTLLISESNAQNGYVSQVLLIKDNDQLITNNSSSIIIWQIKFDTKELIETKTIKDQENIYNISLLLNQSLILLICNEFINFYTIQGEFIKKLKHDVKEIKYFRSLQLDSMKQIILQGKKQLAICKMEI